MKSGDNEFSGLATDGIYSSRIGVRGTEDLGGGLKASFHFEGAMSPDVGTSGGLSFQRRSVLGLEGGFGSIVIGRDYTPLFTVSGVVDPFGTNGVGSAYNLANNIITTDTTTSTIATTFRTRQTGSVAGTNAAASVFEGTVWSDPNSVRMSNAIGYTSPNFSGFTLAAMYSFGSENAYLAEDAGRGASVRLTYAAGPLVVTGAHQMTKGGLVGVASSTTVPTAVAPTADQEWKTNFFGAAYDFGVARLSLGYKTDKLSGDPEFNESFKTGIVGLTAPVGPWNFKASYVYREYDGEKIGSQVAVGVAYDLSNRTALYANYAVLRNEADYGNNVGTAVSTAGQKSRGFEAGIRHVF